MTVYILMALFSCVYAYRRLTRPGMSAEVRFVFIRKHIAYVGTFIFVWTFYLAYSYFKLFYSGYDSSKDKNLQSEEDKQREKNI